MDFGQNVARRSSFWAENCDELRDSNKLVQRFRDRGEKLA